MLLGEFWRDHQHVCLIDQRQPEVAIVVAVAAHTVMHEQHGRIRVVVFGPCNAQDERPVREGRVDVGHVARARAGRDSAKIVGHQRLARATAAFRSRLAPGTERVSSMSSLTLWLMPSKQGVKIIAVGAMVATA